MIGARSLHLPSILAELWRRHLAYPAPAVPRHAVHCRHLPTRVRYTGAGTAYSLGGILGASLAPYIAQQLVQYGGLSWVGGYVSVAAAISLMAAWVLRETRDKELA